MMIHFISQLSQRLLPVYMCMCVCAAILGFHGMLNQVQYHKAFVSGEKDDDGTDNSIGGFQGNTLATTSKSLSPWLESTVVNIIPVHIALYTSVCNRVGIIWLDLKRLGSSFLDSVCGIAVRLCYIMVPCMVCTALMSQFIPVVTLNRGGQASGLQTL